MPITAELEILHRRHNIHFNEIPTELYETLIKTIWTKTFELS